MAFHNAVSWTTALRLLSCATVLALAVALVSFTPQLHQQPNALHSNPAFHSCTLPQAPPAFSRATTLALPQGDSAPLLGPHEGLLRPANVPVFELNVPTLLHKITCRSQNALSALSHAWPSCKSCTSTFFDSTAHTHLVARMAAADRLYEDTQLELAECKSDVARVSEENRQLSAHLLAAVRQLSAVGQTVGTPNAHQPEHVHSVWRSATLSALAVLLLMASMSIGILATKRQATASSQQAKPEDVMHEEEAWHLERVQLSSQVRQQQQELGRAEQTILSLSAIKTSLESRLRGKEQQVHQLQADLAKAEVQRDCASAANMKMPLFPMSPLAAPPARPDTSPVAMLVEDKENMNRAPAVRPSKSHAQAQVGAESRQAQQERSALAAQLQSLEAENKALTSQVTNLQEEQGRLREACQKADEARSQIQLNSEALELRVFTTLEKLALSEEKEADLAAALAATVAAERAAAASQQAQALQKTQLAAAQAERDDLMSRVTDLEAQAAAQALLNEKPSLSHTPAHTPALQDTAATKQATSILSTSDTDCSDEHAQRQQQQQHLEPTYDTDAFGNKDSNASSRQEADLDDQQCLDCPGLEMKHHWQAQGEQGHDEQAGQYPYAGQGGDVRHLTAAVHASMSGRLQIRDPEGDGSAPSSPIYGVACSTAFSSPAVTPSRQGALRGGRPGTPSSGDWFSRVFSSGRRTSTKAGRGSITPTQLFSLNGQPTASSEPEDLFGKWHGQQAERTTEK